MKFTCLLLCAAGVPLLAAAQADQARLAVANANAPVAPLQYQSVFADYAVAKEPAQSPDKGWVHANHALLGDRPQAPTSDQQAGTGVAPATSAPTPTHEQHDYKGTHK